MKLHLCCGAIYLDGYINCDVDGYLAVTLADNPNKTTLEKYFKDPWEPNPKKRKRKDFIIDYKMDILSPWVWPYNTFDEIVMISAFEHFEHEGEIPFIIKQAFNILKPGGVFKFDFPDIKAQVEKYYGIDDEFLMELIYCNHKNKHSRHEWGYTRKTIPNYLTPDKWIIEFKEVVKHDYPMEGVWATKK